MPAPSVNSGELINNEESAVIIDKFINNAKPGQVKSCFFGINKINKILGQDSCIGIRIYQAINGDGKQTFVMVGVDEKEHELNAPGDSIVEYGVAIHIP